MNKGKLTSFLRSLGFDSQGLHDLLINSKVDMTTNMLDILARRTGQPLEYYQDMYEKYRAPMRDEDVHDDQSTNQPMTVYYSIKTFYTPFNEEPFSAEIRVAIPLGESGEAIPRDLLSGTKVLDENLHPQWGSRLDVHEDNRFGFPPGRYRTRCKAFRGMHWEDPLRGARRELGRVKSALHLIWTDVKNAERMPPDEYGTIDLGETEPNAASHE